MAEEELTHAQKIDRHFKIIGKPNPFKTAHSGTPAQRKAGLGSGKGAARYQNTSAEDRRKANTDGKFGYFDEVNKRYVPAIFDMIDGGGRDTRGDEFKGGIFSGMLNDLGVKPYGSQMERAMVSPNTSSAVQAENAVPQGITEAQRMSAAMAEEARQRGLSQDATDPRGRDQMRPSSPFSGSTYDEIPNIYRFDGPTYDEVRPFTMSGDRGFTPTNIAPPAATATPFTFQGDRGFVPTNQAMTAATTTPYTFQGDRGFTPTNIAPPAATAERRIAKRQIVPNPDYAVGVQQLIDYLQSNKGFMGVDNALDDYETMLLTGRYPRA